MTETALERPWEKYRAIVVPDLQAVSDPLAERVDCFVEEGGILIATGRSGFGDEAGEPRPHPAFHALGIEQVGQVRADTRSTYLELDDRERMQRLADTDLVFVDGPYVYADYGQSAQPRLKLIPPHDFGPPERCYYTQVTDHPGFVVNGFGKGRAIHVPWLPGALFHRQGYANTADFCAAVLQGVAGLEPVEGDLSPMVEVTWFEKEDGSCRLLHLVNGSGHFGNSFFAPVPMADLEVGVPCPRKPAKVRDLLVHQDCEFSWAAGRLTVRVAHLELFAALAVELGAR